MTSKERLLIVAVFVIALVGGGILAMNLLGGGGDGGASPSPIASASASPTPTASVTAPPVESPSASAAPSASASAEPPASVSPSATPGASTAPGEPATIVLTGLKLDAKEDPDGIDRSVGFRTDGTGDVTATVSVVSPPGNVVMCLGVDGGQPDCITTADGKLTAAAPDGGGDFVLALRGEGVEAPVVDVTITFPATAPAVIIAGARFDGTLYPDTNGITATVTPRRNGDLTLAADWGGHPFLYGVELREEGGEGAVVLADQGPATRMTETWPVTAPNPWTVGLRNAEDGFGPTELDATIAWP
jgi:hypothetical protein